MNEKLLFDDNLKNSYLNLKKVSAKIKADYNKIIKVDFGEDEWKKEGRKINNNIREFEKNLNEATDICKKAKINESASEEVIKTVEEGLNKIKNAVNPMARAMKDKIKQFSLNNQIDFENQENNINEEEDGEEEQQQEEILLDILNNNEMLEKRRKDLLDVHKASVVIKDLSQKMAQDLNKQGEILDQVEENVIKVEENVEEAGKEIVRADKLSKNNTKKLCCIIIIVLVAVGVILAVVLSLIL